jgi:hypothetical protein
VLTSTRGEEMAGDGYTVVAGERDDGFHVRSSSSKFMDSKGIWHPL